MSLLRLLLLAGVALAFGSAVRPVWTIDPDAAAYLSLARSLAQDEAYVLDGVPHAKYPPGLPSVLAIAMRLGDGPDDYALFHAILVACVVGAVALSDRIVRQLGYPDAAALAVAACVGTSQILFELSVVYLRTEPLFVLLSLAALSALLGTCSRDGGVLGALAAGLLTSAATLTRLAGVTLLVVPLLAFVRPSASGGQRGRALLAGLIGTLGLAGWAWHGWTVRQAHPEAPDYALELVAAQPRDLTKTIRLDMPRLDAAGAVRRVIGDHATEGNAQVLARATGVLLTNAHRTGSKLVIGVGLLALVALGLVSLWRRGPPHADVAAYVVATIALYLVWPFNQQERFYVPLLPLLLLAAGEALTRLWALAQRLSTLRHGGLLLLLLSGAAVLVLAGQRSDHPALLGRWSHGYAALLLAATLTWLILLLAVLRGPLPRLAPALWLAIPIFYATPTVTLRLVEWPARVAAFEAERAGAELPRDVAAIDVHPTLEAVALWLRAHTPRDTVVMTDVPKMLAILADRRCIPFTYTLDPPEIHEGDADYVFYTRELPDVALLMDARALRFDVAATFGVQDLGGREIVPTLFATR